MSENEPLAGAAVTEQTACARWSMTLAALEHLDQGYSIFDQELRLVAWNKRFLELLDFPLDLAQVGTPFAAFIRYNVDRGEYGPGDQQSQFEQRIQQARAFQSHCFERVRPDGTVLEVRGNPIAGGGFITIYTDITARKLADLELQQSHTQLETRVAERTVELEALNAQLAAEVASHKQTAMALQRSESWIRSIADAVPALIAYVDARQCYGFANQKHREWFGSAPSAIVGRPLREVLGEALYQRVQGAVQAALSGVEGSIEYQVTTTAGRTLDVCSSFIPHHGEGERVLGFFLLGQDLTHYKQAQRALNRGQRMEAIGQLTGGIAHDFNNLLTLIMGNLAFLKKHLERNRDTAPEWLKAVQTSMNAARCGADLIRRLLAFSRQQSLKPKVLSLEWQATELDDFLRRTLGEAITLDTRVDTGVWKILADPNQLVNAVLNLAINARDAMPRGGTLTIKASNITVGSMHGDPDVKPGDYVLLSVSDTGSGMPPEVAERAVEPFFSTKEPGSGTGLGLSMVYGFVRQSGGHLRILSEPGQGTTVQMYLPKAPTAVNAPANIPVNNCEYGHGETILLVEDDPDVRHFISHVLDELGYAVQEAEDGPTALSILKRDPRIALLLSDLVIPGAINGHELINIVQRQCPTVKVLCMSGHPEKTAMERDLLGCVTLDKPFQQQDLARAVREVLEHG
ncbi:MAG: PAS-domain containing protein [Gammaproteobacteria bacterium]|nr:PAS-domain containing protein [Gammaproteobacteria bacterium]MCP5424619.1 PAS-domain containing protein [Gammaproteobacteria bacterium]